MQSPLPHSAALLYSLAGQLGTIKSFDMSETQPKARIRKWISIVSSILPYPLALAAAYSVNSPVLFPLAASLLFFPVFFAHIRREAFTSALLCSILWAVTGSVLVILLTIFKPHVSDSLILNGQAYSLEMLRWIGTGEGAESTFSIFFPQHLLHLAVFTAATLISAGYLGLTAGSFLLNYMNAYVGTYVAVSGTGPAGVLLAWHPWALIRVGAYLVLGVYLSALTLKTIRKIENLPPRRWVYFGVSGLVLDILLKTVLAPHWRKILLFFSSSP